jgi:hypothetical protein
MNINKKISNPLIMKISLNIIIIFIFLTIIIIFLFNIKNNIVDNFTNNYIPIINRKGVILNGVNYGNNVQITPCLNKSDDFDTWCKYYQDVNKVPEGMNKNNIGAKKILNGKDGECYLDIAKKKEDINSARALCDFNSIEEVSKLDPLLGDSSYNFFTECQKIENDGIEDIFKKKCTQLLGTDKIDIEQIMGYDCNPGYGRAKCLKQFDEYEYNKENVRDEGDNEEQNDSEEQGDRIIASSKSNGFTSEQVEKEIEEKAEEGEEGEEGEEKDKKNYKSKYFGDTINKFKTNFGKLF